MTDKRYEQEDANGEPLVSHAKAAEMCGMTRAAILDLIRRGRLGSVEVEGRTLVYRKEVEAFERGERQAIRPESVERA